MPEAPQWLELVIARWKAAGVRVRNGNSLEGIRTFEERHGLVLPVDLVAYFFAVDGMEPDDLDEKLIRFWPLEEVRPVLAELPEADAAAHQDLYLFADACLWAHGYAIRLRPGSPNDVVLTGGRMPLPIATSFTEFMAKYVSQADAPD